TPASVWCSSTGTKPPTDRFANLVFHQKLGDVFSKL
ncbi:hypothetical protein EVA_14553, partial [gut metagenome]